MEYDNNNKGVLFVNKGKKSEKHPDYDGKINVEGKDWAIAGWKRTSKSGATFLSLKVSEPRVEVNGKSAQQEEVDF